MSTDGYPACDLLSVDFLLTFYCFYLTTILSTILLPVLKSELHCNDSGRADCIRIIAATLTMPFDGWLFLFSHSLPVELKPEIKMVNWKSLLLTSSSPEWRVDPLIGLSTLHLSIHPHILNEYSKRSSPDFETWGDHGSDHLNASLMCFWRMVRDPRIPTMDSMWIFIFLLDSPNIILVSSHPLKYYSRQPVDDKLGVTWIWILPRRSSSSSSYRGCIILLEQSVISCQSAILNAVRRHTPIASG